MITRLAGTIVRAGCVVVLIAMPSLLLPGVSPDMAQIVALIALFSAALVAFEYASTYPGLVEFRDAPPFNRIRFGALFTMVLLLTLVSRGQHEPSALSAFVTIVGHLVGEAIDFPYSPVRLVLLMLPPDSSPELVQIMRASAGLGLLVTLMTLAAFLIVLRLVGWPKSTGSFNVWVNLPTFDPTAGGDVVERLERDARVNIALGFVMPFLVPAVINAASSTFGAMSLEQPQTMIWTVAAWAFLPASLFMRGIAMHRIAVMIAEKRKMVTVDDKEEPGLLAV